MWRIVQYALENMLYVEGEAQRNRQTCIMRIYYVADGPGVMFVWGPCSTEEGGPLTHMDAPSYSVRTQGSS